MICVRCGREIEYLEKIEITRKVTKIFPDNREEPFQYKEYTLYRCPLCKSVFSSIKNAIKRPRSKRRRSS